MINVWSLQLRHATQEEILALLEGELRPAEARRLQAHLDRCWTCRSEKAAAELAIHGFVAYRQASLAAIEMPEGSTERFLTKLRAAAVQPAARPARPYLRYAAAAAVVAAVGVASFWRLHQPPGVSAAEILRKVEQAESSRLQAVPDPVIRQRLQIRRRSGGHVSVALERDPALLEVLAANRLAPASTLDGSLYRQFRPRAVRESARETASESGVAIWRLEASADAVRTGSVRSAALSVRREDAHPIEETLTVQRAGFSEEFQIREVAFAVVPRSSLSVNAVPMAVPVSPSKTISTAPGESGESVDVIEVDLHYALHRIGACLGEAISVRRDGPGYLRVAGVVDDSVHRNRILAALQPWKDNPLVRVELATPDAAAQSERPVTRLGLQAYRRSVPVANLLRGGNSGQQPAEWMYQALRASDQLLAESFALRKLEEVFPAARAAALPLHSRWLLEQMAEEHLQGLETRLTALTAKLRLVPGWAPSAPEPNSAPPTAATLLEQSRRISETVSGLIAAPQVTAEETIRAVESLGRQLPQLEATVAAYPRPSRP